MSGLDCGEARGGPRRPKKAQEGLRLVVRCLACALHHTGTGKLMKPPITPQRVLVVDDEALMCWSLAEILTVRGDTVTQARTGAAAIRALKEAREPIDVEIGRAHV